MADKETEVKVTTTTVDPKGEVTVNLDENNEPIKTDSKAKEEPRYVRPEDLEPIRKGQNYTSSAIRKIEEKLEKLLQTPTQPVRTEAPRPVDEWDKKVQENWKGTVEELAELKFQEMMERRERENALRQEKLKSDSLLEENKRKVLERHKELLDNESDKAKVYMDVIQRHPEYIGNPFGPVLAMRDMEDEMRERGVLDEPTKKQVEKEVTRQTRAAATTVPSGARGATTKVVLSKDDIEYCKVNGINYDTYAKMRQMQNTNGSVEIK